MLRVIVPAGVTQKSSQSATMIVVPSDSQCGVITAYHDGPTGAPVCIEVKLPNLMACTPPLSRYSRACHLASCSRANTAPRVRNAQMAVARERAGDSTHTWVRRILPELADAAAEAQSLAASAARANPERLHEEQDDLRQAA